MTGGWGMGRSLFRSWIQVQLKCLILIKKLIATSERVKISAQNFDSNYTRSLLLGSRLRGLNLLT